MILCIDPSSKRTGYALMAAATGPQLYPHLIEAGHLKPRRTKDRAIDRVDAMCDDLFALIDEHLPDVIVIEMPSGKAGTGSKRGARSSLAIYGMAAGALRALAREAVKGRRRDGGADASVIDTDERTWTRAFRDGGRTASKQRRQQIIAAMYPEYAHVMATGKGADRDAGGDISDAIGLGYWWFELRKGHRCVA